MCLNMTYYYIYLLHMKQVRNLEDLNKLLMEAYNSLNTDNHELIQELYALRECKAQLDTIINYYLLEIVQEHFKTKYNIELTNSFFNV